MTEEDDFDSEKIKYIMGCDNTYSVFMVNDTVFFCLDYSNQLHIKSPSYVYNEILKEINNSPMWYSISRIQQFQKELNQLNEVQIRVWIIIVQKRKNGIDKDRMEYLEKSYNLVLFN